MIDFNDVEDVPARFDLTELRERLAASAAHWLPGYFPNGVMSRDRRSIRCADLTGRAPNNVGSAIIHLVGPRAGWGHDFGTNESAGPIDLIAYATGLSGKSLFEEAARIVGMQAHRPPPRPAPPRKDPALEIARIVNGCVPLAGTLGEHYLSTRGLQDPHCPDLLFHPDLTDFETKRGYDGIVAIVRNAKGEQTGGILRIFLSDDGSGKAAAGKKMFGSVSGGSVRLAAIGADGHLGVGEGVETALAASKIFGVPCWSSLSAGGLAGWEWPAEARRVTIFADAGEPGLLAAQQLSERLKTASIPCEIKVPLYDDDFCDDLKRGATATDYAEQPEIKISLDSPTAAPAVPRNYNIVYDDFWTYLPMLRWLYVPTREMWPAGSVNAQLPPKKVGDKDIPASQWLAKHRAVEQMTWQPGAPMVMEDWIISDGGWISHPGRRVFNLYRPPELAPGDPLKAQPWIDHVRFIYPNEADHLFRWFAHRVQKPGQKINHAIVLGGSPGVGKDSLLEGIKYAVGSWNFAEVTPKQLLGRFNAFIRSVIVRISEARDLGEVDRYAFYDATKIYMASPPDVLRCDEKHIREYSVPNVCSVIITSNHKSGGLYLPSDDRRHFVAWSDRVREDFPDGYWRKLWSWYEAGGKAHVAAFLASLDLSDFDAKQPPLKTPAFWEMADSNQSGEDGELADSIDRLGGPDALTIDDVREKATGAFAEWLCDRKNRRALPHRLEEAGYVRVRNPSDKNKGFWKVQGRRQAIYARNELSAEKRLAVVYAYVQSRGV